jgi:hypothetical protein
MTDKEIVQVLRCCRLANPCTSCPAEGRGKEVCFDEVHAAAVAAIERLTAENAALKRRYGKLAACFVRGLRIARKGLSRAAKKAAIIARRNRIARAGNAPESGAAQTTGNGVARRRKEARHE